MDSHLTDEYKQLRSHQLQAETADPMNIRNILKHVKYGGHTIILCSAVLNNYPFNTLKKNSCK